MMATTFVNVLHLIVVPDAIWELNCFGNECRFQKLLWQWMPIPDIGKWLAKSLVWSHHVWGKSPKIHVWLGTSDLLWRGIDLLFQTKDVWQLLYAIYWQCCHDASLPQLYQLPPGKCCQNALTWMVRFFWLLESTKPICSMSWLTQSSCCLMTNGLFSCLRYKVVDWNVALANLQGAYQTKSSYVGGYLHYLRVGDGTGKECLSGAVLIIHGHYTCFGWTTSATHTLRRQESL